MLLLEVAKEFVSVIDNKKTDGNTVEAKRLAWTALTNKYNAVSETGSRTEKQLHALYDNLKKKARKNMGGGYKSGTNTGGDSFFPQTTPIGEKVMTLLVPQYRQPTNDCEPSTSFYNVGVVDVENREVKEGNEFAGDIVVKIEPDEESESEKSIHEGAEAYSSDDSLRLEIDYDSESEKWSSHSVAQPGTSENVMAKMDDNWMSESSTSKQNGCSIRPASPKDNVGSAPKLETQSLTETRKNNLNNPRPSYNRRNNLKEANENKIVAKRLEILELQRQQEVMKLEKTKMLMDLDIELKRMLLESAKIDLEAKKLNFKF